MTVTEVYTSALSLLPSSRQEDDSLRHYALLWANTALAEMFEVENSIRMNEEEAGRPGRSPLTEIPLLEKEDEEVPYSGILVRGAMVYFMASLMAKDDDTDAWAIEYRNRYVVALNEAKKHIPTLIEDVYAGNNE